MAIFITFDIISHDLCFCRETILLALGYHRYASREIRTFQLWHADTFGIGFENLL